jgi:phenolic acid decarboxylase
MLRFDHRESKDIDFSAIARTAAIYQGQHAKPTGTSIAVAMGTLA